MSLGVWKYYWVDQSFIFYLMEHVWARKGAKGNDDVIVIQGPRTLFATCFSFLFLVLLCLCHTIFFILADYLFHSHSVLYFGFTRADIVSLAITATPRNPDHCHI